MTLAELKQAALGLADMGHPDRIKLFGWWLHAHGGKAHFQGADIKKCYDELHIGPPSSFGPYMAQLEKTGHFLKSSAGYRLEHKVRESFDAKYGAHKQKLPIKNLLKELPAKLPTLAERKYLDEALICYENEALRATVVMTWNLAYAHLCDHVLKNHLADFNARWQLKFPGMHKNGPKNIATMDDFNDEQLKEHQVLEICRDAGIIGKNIFNVLEPALKRRNAAAHPNNVMIDQLQTDAYIADLITNALLKIA